MSKLLLRRAHLIRAAVTVVLVASLTEAFASHAQASPWDVGDQFVAIDEGKYQVWSPSGILKETLDDGLAGSTTGCIDGGGKLYTTDWTGKVVVYDDADPHPILRTIDIEALDGSIPESITFDPSGNLLVGTVPDGVGGLADVLKLAPDGTLIDNYDVQIEVEGADWIDLSSDVHTLFYTSEGSRVMRYDLATKTQLSDFATLSGAAATAYAMRLLAPGDGSGGLLVADADKIRRLDASGNVIRTYDRPSEDFWFSLNLDPDGTSFWASGYDDSHVYRFDIATGALLKTIDTGVGSFRLHGICPKTALTAASADLSVVKVGSPSPVGPGSNVTYTIQVANGGPDAASSAVVSDNLPSSLTFVSCSSTGGGVCGGTGNNRTVRFSSVAAGASATVTIVATVKLSTTGGSKIDNTASITASTTDPNLANNNSTGRVVTSLDPSIYESDVSVVEGNVGTATATFTVSLSAASLNTVQVTYATANGTATAGSDYIAIPATALSFAPGQTTKTVSVTVNGDTAFEGNETFLLKLSNPLRGIVADAQGTGTIIDDEGAISFYVSDVSVQEGNSGTQTATFTVSLSAAPLAGQTVSIKVATADGTATSGSDYVAVPLTTLSFAPGQTSQTVSVTVNGDTTLESNESFLLKLSAPIRGVIADTQGQATIIDDD